MKVLERSDDGVRGALTDEAWTQLEPVVLKVVGPRGRPAKQSLREFIEPVISIDRTGMPWRDLPLAFGPWDTVYQCFRRWTQRG